MNSKEPGQGEFDSNRRYSRINVNYRSANEVTAALRRAGLESSNLIVGIDFTKSNEWTGSRSFNGYSLHHIWNGQNPYQQAISIMGQTLSAFDEGNMIPCYGFGDLTTHDHDVFSFYDDDRPCDGFEEVLHGYRDIVTKLRFTGPTSFAPIIEMAMTIVEQTGGQFHILLIIADGQVSPGSTSVDTHNNQLSVQEQKSVDAIVKASEYPIVNNLVGVGDGPWDMMKNFDDNIPARAFDNFQFVNFTEIMSRYVNFDRRQTEFTLAALMKIPSQYQATVELGLLGRRRGSSPKRVPLLPPLYIYPRSPRANGSPTRTPSNGRHNQGVGNTPSSSSPNQTCPICVANPKDMGFGCGHQAIYKPSVYKTNALGSNYKPSVYKTSALGSNYKPSVYKTKALPLSYRGC
ncbi:E3 ubiquitin-protein ligase RGLG5, partial [Cucurbita argyrosperma subsp. sororia]